jgi:hypothetical protein
MPVTDLILKLYAFDIFYLSYFPSKRQNGPRSMQERWLRIRWGDMSICGLLFQWASIIKIQLSVLVYYKANLIIILLKINLFCYDIA